MYKGGWGKKITFKSSVNNKLEDAGTFEVCITALTNCCVVLTGYHDQHQVIQWFWQAIEKFDNERRLRLLQVDYEITAVRDSGVQH